MQPDSNQTNQIREAISKLALDRPEREVYNPYREQDYLVPQWKDITKLLDDATNDLEVGQLVHLQSFTLFDAMSAIEIMDPKMDTGMILEGDKKKPFDPLKSLSAEQVLWIMDRLLSCEENISASGRAEEPAELVSSVLKAYVLATIKCCHLVWREMVSGNVYEEEDFTTNLFGLSLGEHYPDTEVLNALDSAIYWLSVFKQTITGEANVVFEGLHNRLHARKNYLLAHTYLAQPQCEWYRKAESELNQLTKLLVTTEVGSINKTQTMGKEVDDAFDENINRILTSQTPPRPIILPSHQEALELFANLSRRLTSLCSIVDYQSVASLLNFCKYYASTRPYPDAFSRSKLNAVTVDEKLKEICPNESKFYFYHWTNHRRLNMLETILLIGFELELYGQHEYVMIYWFIDYLLTYRYNVYAHIQTNLPISEVYQALPSSRGQSSQSRQRICEFQSLQMLNSVKQDVNMGVLRTLQAIERLNLIKKPALAFDDEETRYRHRFKAFANLWNFELPPYEHFRTEISYSRNQPEASLHAAQLCFARAQGTLKRLILQSPSQTKTELCIEAFKTDLQALMRTCISNQVAITQLQKKNNAKIELSFEYHRNWPVFKVIDL
ncbi:N-alpha-acetyltransferase [Umbelopsis nana]